MEKKSKKSIVIGMTVLLLVMLTLVGLTYAYYRTRIIGNQNEKSLSVTSKLLEVTYSDDSAVITASNIEPEYTISKTFTVENTGDGTTNYNIVFDNVENEFGMYIDWVYILEYGEESVTGYVKRSDEQVILNDVSINVGEVVDYKLTLVYKDTGVNQSFDMGKSLSLRVNITDSPIIDAVSKTGTELKAMVDANKTITLTQDTILTTPIILDDTVEVLDLNGYTLIVNPTVEGSLTYIETDATLEIKNGTIKRGNNLVNGSLIIVYNTDSNLIVNDVIVDGNNVKAIEVTDDFSRNLASSAINCIYCNSLTINDSIIKNNYGVGSGIGIKADRGNALSINQTEIKDNFNSSADENSSLSTGVALYANGMQSVEIKESKILNNIAENGIGTIAVTSCGSYSIDELSEVKYNVGQEAGGMRVEGANSDIRANIEGNISTATDGNGGGVYTILTTESKTINISADIANNIAGGAGGGIYVNGPKSSSVPGIVNFLGGNISGNVSIGTPNSETLKDGGGGGIYVSRGKMAILGGLVENNYAMSNIGNAILVSHAGGNVNGGHLEISAGAKISGSVEVSKSYGTLVLNGVTQNGNIIN